MITTSFVKNTVMIIGTLTMSLPALAGKRHHHYSKSYDNCIVEDVVHVKTVQVGQGPCQVISPLQLVETTRSYPLLGYQTYNVQYWNALVGKEVRYKSYSTKYVTNTCTRQQISATQVVEADTSYETFGIVNPNLSNAVSATYELSPMTEQEAQAAVQAQLESCRRAK